MTADQDLSARLAEFAKSDCRDNEFAKWCQTAWQAYSTGQLITLADHERAVQAAVAKTVDELAPAIPHDNDCINFARYNSDECSCGRDVWIADIRARKEATP